MNRVIKLAAIIVVGALAWRALGIIDRGALALIIGILIGAFASLPTALAVLAHRRG